MYKDFIKRLRECIKILYRKSSKYCLKKKNESFTDPFFEFYSFMTLISEVTSMAFR